MLFCPMHARALQACFDHQLVATFHDPAANRPALGLEKGVLHLVSAFLQIRQIAGDSLIFRVLLLEFLQFIQEAIWPIVFQAMPVFFQPGLAFWCMFS